MIHVDTQALWIWSIMFVCAATYLVVGLIRVGEVDDAVKVGGGALIAAMIAYAIFF